VLWNKYYEGGYMEEDEMSVACGTCRGEEKCIQSFGGET